MAIVFFGVPIVVTAFSMALGLNEMNLAEMLMNGRIWNLIPLIIPGIISGWALLEFALLRGTAGPNQYGPDPLQRQAV